MPRQSETRYGTGRWLAQSTLGILLLAFMGTHLVVNHWVAPQGLLTYADVIHYYDVPGIIWMEILFLTVVTTHCLMGVHAILLDLALSPTMLKLLTWSLLMAGLMIITFGIRLIWIVANL